MKPSTFPLSLIFLISTQLLLAYSQDSIIGKWTDPSVSNNYNPACCAPTTLMIQATASMDILLATYQYEDNHKLGYTDHCYDLFGTTSPAKINLVLKKGTDDIYEAQRTYGADSKTVTFNYEIKTAGMMLSIYTPETDNFWDGCEITMFSPMSSKLWKVLKFVFFGAIVVLVLALVWRWFRRRQVGVKEDSVSMNSALNPTEQNNA